MKRKLTVFVSIMLIVSMALGACGSTPSPSEVTKAFLEAVKSDDGEAASKIYSEYESAEELFADAESAEGTSSGLSPEVQDELQRLTQEFDYTIGQETIDGDKATVEVSITTYDFGTMMGKVMGEYILAAFGVAFSGLPEEEMNQKLTDLFNEGMKAGLDGLSEKNHTASGTIEFTKGDGGWEISALSEEFQDAMMGGMLSAIESMDTDNSSANETSPEVGNGADDSAAAAGGENAGEAAAKAPEAEAGEGAADENIAGTEAASESIADEAAKSGNDKEAASETESEAGATESTSGGYQLESFTPIDNDECLITIKDIVDDPIWGTSINIALENKSADKTYMFSANDIIINGVQCDGYFAKEVAPGKKANDSISLQFSDSGLTENGITEYTDIEVFFRVYDSDDWMADAVVDESVHIYPYGEDKASSFVREPADTDIVIVDNNAVTAVVTGTYDDEIWGYTVGLYLVNKTDKELMFSIEDAAVNGFMADPYFARTIRPGACRFTSASWMDSTLEENNITEVEEIEFALRAYDNNDWMGDDLARETVILK